MTERREEIIEEIADNLRRWTQPESAVLKGIGEHLDLLRSANAEFGNEGSLPRGAECKKVAQELEPALIALTDIIDKLPAGISNILFENFGRPLGGPSSRGEFSRQLRVLRKASAILEHVKAPSKNADLTKSLCAGFAHRIVCEFSDRPPTATVDGPMRTVASLLYEAVSGRPETDLKRACDDQLKRERAFSREREVRTR